MNLDELRRTYSKALIFLRPKKQVLLVKCYVTALEESLISKLADNAKLREECERLREELRKLHSMLTPTQVDQMESQLEKEKEGEYNSTSTYPLFEHMSREHGMVMTDSQLNEIVRIAKGVQ